MSDDAPAILSTTEPAPTPAVADAWHFQFQREEDGTPGLLSAVYQALGAASVCWDSMEGTGVFQSERAQQIGEALMAIIEETYGPVPA